MAQKFWQKDGFIITVYALAAVMVSVQRLSLGRSPEGYTAYENYIIFKNSFGHLVSGLNPYANFFTEHWDLYKYSPAFALFMGLFAALPDEAGLILWNLLNALALLGAILLLPLDAPHKRFLAWFILPELVVSMQNSQSNGLTAALILWTWVAMERQKIWQAGWWAASGAFLKIFGGFAAIPALLYPQREKFIITGIFWGVLLALIPVVAVWPGQLPVLYQWWWELLQADHTVSVGLSVAGWLESWFGWIPGKTLITLVGLALLLSSILLGERTLSPLIQGADFKYAPPVNQIIAPPHIILAWASVLIWVVIFNHKAESPTFVIALCGVGLWYLAEPEPGPWKKVLLAIAFAFVSLSTTDLFPKPMRKALIEPFVLKAVPCIAIWILITVQLFRLHHKNRLNTRGTQ